MWSCAGVLLIATCAFAITRDQFYPYGQGLDEKLAPGNSLASPEVFLKVPVLFYGETYETVFVNNFGVLTFRADIPSYMNTEFPLPYPSIAAFYSNVDTSKEGAVYYRETSEPHILSKAEESVQNNFHDYFDFKPTSVFLTTWLDVTYTSTGRNKKNSFQIAIISNGTETFVEFLYPDKEIQWIRAETQPGNQPDAYAQAGFVAEDGRMYTLRGSGSHQIRNIILWSNTHEPGKYVYRVGALSPESNIFPPDQYNQIDIEVEEESKTCAQSGPSVCHIEAKCIDYQTGICCQCNDGYYGNGKSCIRNDTPLRVHGKLNGVLNNIHLNDVNVQAYVIVAEGRTYTALALAPQSLGRSLQLLNVIGETVGWMFAKPSGSVTNGYQTTGAVFNHTAEVFFPGTNDRVFIHQEYLGHDVFDQIVMEIDVRGTLPIISQGIKLEQADYSEQYRVGENGVIRSESTKTLINKETGDQYEMTISQTFSYSPCAHAPVSDASQVPVTLKVSKNYLGYEIRDNIVRYGSSNKIIALSQEDSCIKGQEKCGSHSTCVAQEQSFICVCQPGYSSIYQNDILVCIDFDECVAGTHNCDANAECINHEGGFQCRCNSGFKGNGVTCRAPSSCQDRKCDINAECIESAEGPICVCSSGYTGDGRYCWQMPEFACANCSPYASCPFSRTSNSYICQCNPGYFGDGYNCESGVSSVPTPYETYPSTESSSAASSTPTSQYNEYTARTYSPYYEGERRESSSLTTNEADYNDTFVLPNCDQDACTCPPGYTSFKDDRDNELCRLEGHNIQQPISSTPYDDSENPYHCTTDNECPPNAVCSATELRCVCSEGFEGDGYECLERPDSRGSIRIYRCQIDSDCPPNAVCSYGEGEPRCICPEGYDGNAYDCIERTSPSCNCGRNARCLESVPGELLCVCDAGYQGDGYQCTPNFSCTDNSDCEYNAECKPHPTTQELICQCVEGFVKDQNDACIPDGQLCNGGFCTDHASCLYDERLQLRYCHCDEGFEGDGISNCVEAGHTCDVAHDCSADAQCVPTETTYQCICREGYSGDGYTCTPELSCRADPYMCSPQASCLKRGDGYVCECNTGYNGNGTLCVLNARLSGNFLVVSEGATIYRVPFQMGPRDHATPFNSGIDQIAVGIDVDCESGRIYWGDVVGNTIKRAAYDGSGFEEFLRVGVISPEGISIDWSARNIFWTDSKKLTIEVANMETRVRKVLFAIDGISNPRGIVVHPQKGKIFWSDWNRRSPKIEWANMDGTHRDVFLDTSDVSLPNSLAIDWATDRLCYADAGQLSINCVHIDTMERVTIASNCKHPFSLAINGQIFYWTDWKTLKIQFADTITNERGEFQMSVTSRPYGLAVAPDQCPALNNMCMNHSGGCGPDQLCLPDGEGGRTCVNGDITYREIN